MRMTREIFVNERSKSVLYYFWYRESTVKCRVPDLAAQSCRRVFIDEHFVASHCLPIHQMKPRRRSLSEQL